MADKQSPVIRSMNDVESSEVQRSRGATIQVLIGPEQGAPNFVTRSFTLAPGGRIPRHRHESIEHQQVILSGEMVLGLDDQEQQVRTGDSILIPPGVAHWYENREEQPVRFLCIVPNADAYQTEWLEAPVE
jgi:quercetin dioxygenase-like cupin family protein